MQTWRAFLMKLLLIQANVKKESNNKRRRKAKSMKKRKLWKAMSAALSAVMLATSVPSAAFAAVPARTADVQTKAADEDELKLWYDEKAPDSYDGWEKWSLPLGNSGIGASVFGGITQERIQLK